MTISLRPYQLAAIDAIRARFAAGDRSTLAVLATGLGKAVIAADIARRTAARSRRTLLLAHHEELVEQLANKVRACGVAVGVEMAGQRAPADVPCVAASVPTLRGARLHTFAPDAFDVVIADEAHHATATSWRAVCDRFAHARLLGFTATPDRADGTPLADVFASVAFRYELPDAIRDGWLCQLIAHRVVVDSIDLSKVRASGTDLNAEQLAAVMEHARAVQGVVEPLLQLVGDRPTIAFAVSVAHAYQLAAEINARAPHLAARVIHGDMPRDQRHAALCAYESLEARMLINVDVLSEGFDAPHTACIALIRPTKSRARCIQRIGRGTRLHPSKRDCMIIDFTGNAGKHSLVGPADALAGDNLPAEVRAHLERILAAADAEDADARNLTTALARARWDAEQERIEQARGAVVRWRAKQVDKLFGTDPLPRRDRDSTPATAEQLTELADAGLTNPPASLTRDQAQQVIDRLAARGLAGLCSLAVAKRIAPSGIDTRNLTAQRARQLLGILRRNGFRPWALRNQPEAQTPEAIAFRVARAQERRAEKQAKEARAKTRAAQATERAA